MNNFAIEAVQSLFKNMLNVPQSELGTTVMHFREEVKNLVSRNGSLSPEIWCFGCRSLHGNWVIVSIWIVARLWTSWSSICWIVKAR